MAPKRLRGAPERLRGVLQHCGNGTWERCYNTSVVTAPERGVTDTVVTAPERGVCACTTLCCNTSLKCCACACACNGVVTLKHGHCCVHVPAARPTSKANAGRDRCLTQKGPFGPTKKGANPPPPHPQPEGKTHSQTTLPTTNQETDKQATVWIIGGACIDSPGVLRPERDGPGEEPAPRDDRQARG